MLETLQMLDGQILLFLQEHVRCGVLDVIMKLFTHLGDAGVVWLALGAVMLTTRKYRRGGLCLLLSVGLCYCLNDLIIKILVARPRPFLTVPGLVAIVAEPGSYSFPSGHACSSFASAYALTWRYGRRGAWFYVPAALIALSRPYVGVHYLSDILIGAGVGTLGAAGVCCLFEKLERREIQKNSGRE